VEEVISEKRPGERTLGNLALALFFAASGCSFFNPPTFTEGQLKGVDTTLTYRDVLSDYRSLSGKKVILGGWTVHLDNRTTQAYVQMSPAPLDPIFRPKPHEGGTDFLLVFPYPVDPSAMAVGRRITVIGRVRRMKRPSLTDGGRTVRLVTIDVLSLHTWVPRTTLIGGSPYPVMTPGFSGPYQTP
jgi:outer membrane lipoprotein